MVACVRSPVGPHAHAVADGLPVEYAFPSTDRSAVSLRAPDVRRARPLDRAQDVASDGGDLLDHVLDRYADIAVIAGFSAGIDAYAVGFLAVTGSFADARSTHSGPGVSRSTVAPQAVHEST